MLPGTNIRKIRNWPNLPNIIARQKNVIYSMHNLFCVYIYMYIYFCFCGGRVSSRKGGGGGGGASQIEKGQGSVRTAFGAYV